MYIELFFFSRYLLGDPQHQTFLPSPLLCPRLNISCLTVVTPSLYRSHPTTISLLSSHCSPVIITLLLSHHFPVIPLLLFPSFVSPFLCLHSYSLSHTAYFIIILFYWFHFYFLTPIYPCLYLYTPFPSRDPHLFLLGSPAM